MVKTHEFYKVSRLTSDILEALASSTREVYVSQSGGAIIKLDDPAAGAQIASLVRTHYLRKAAYAAAQLIALGMNLDVPPELDAEEWAELLLEADMRLHREEKETQAEENNGTL
jgi:hypothetical protein